MVVTPTEKLFRRRSAHAGVVLCNAIWADWQRPRPSQASLATNERRGGSRLKVVSQVAADGSPTRIDYLCVQSVRPVWPHTHTGAMSREPVHDEPHEFAVARVAETDWKHLKAVRLAALTESPEAFGSGYSTEERFAEDDWRNWARNWVDVCSVPS